MLPVGIATSFAFMLPVATPPNALGFEYGQMKILDMVRLFSSPLALWTAHSAARHIEVPARNFVNSATVH